MAVERDRVSRAGRPAGLASAIVLVLAGSVGQPSVVGYWTGTIGVAGDKSVEIKIDVTRKDEGWRARFYAPVQGIHGVELTHVEISGRSVRFRIPQAVGEPTFRGELSVDGVSISGKFDDGGESLPFRLTRAERPAGLDTDIYAEYRKPGLPGVGIAGAWRGLLMTGPNRMRLALDIRRGKIDPIGQSVDEFGGSLTSLDQGGQAQQLDSVQLVGDSVRFEMLGIGALYKGTMKPDGSEFFGVWIQQGTEFPLTFRRVSQAAVTDPPE